MKFVCAFQPGDNVPEWLMYRTPFMSDSVEGVIAFAVRVEIWEWNESYLILPADGWSGQAIFVIAGCRGVSYGAASKRIILPIQVRTFEVDGGGEDLVFGGKDA